VARTDHLPPPVQLYIPMLQNEPKTKAGLGEVVAAALWTVASHAEEPGQCDPPRNRERVGSAGRSGQGQRQRSRTRPRPKGGRGG
jgi:hypothetical protein